MKNTEEDIKQKVIMPFLKSIGFEENELDFEKSFPLRLNQYTVRVDTEKQIKTACPRLDILVKRNGQNLFVFEVKTDSKDLTDEDREQAILYARLVHPMAPLAIVTNGKEFKIYKVGDKSEIDNDKTKILNYNIGQDIENLYEEALEYFIGYSYENVRVFCNAQIKEGIKTLLGSKEKPDRKFIPELYVPSKKLMKIFNDFMESDKSVFALIGESGSGKTCSMCGLAIDLVNNHPVLFYRAVNLTEGLIKSVANDFNWEFSTHLDDIALFKRINRIFKDKKIIIFIDGVDEWGLHNKVEGLGDFASKIRNRNFKLVISCKSGQWNRFLSKSGTPTVLSEEIFNTDKASNGYFIEPFDGEEFHSLIEKYRNFYEFKGFFESDVLEECKRLPFLLRVFFKVAYKIKCPHLTFSVKEFYDEYYKAVIEKIPEDKEKAENTIKAIAQVLFEKNLDAIDMDIMRKELKLNINETIIPSLFECNILEKTTVGLESQIGFYFQKFRDYIIVFGVKRWNKISINDFKEDWLKLNFKNVQFDVISFFYQFADIDKKKVIDETIRTNAEAYLNLYINVLDEHFCNLKHRFSPKTKGSIGFIGDMDIKSKRISAYGFRAIEGKDERVKLIPIEGGFWVNQRTNLPYLMGATEMHYRGSCNGFNNLNIKKEVLEFEIYDQLEKIVDNGLLNETNNYYLSLEKVLGILVKRQSNLHGIKNKSKLSQYLPLSIDKVEYGLRYEKAAEYFHDKLIKEKIEKAIIKPVWSGSTGSYGYSFTSNDWQLIHKQAHEAALSKEGFDTNNINLRKVEEILKEALSTINKRKGIIDEAILPDEDAIEIESTGYFSDFFKKETLISFVFRLYTLFLEEYKVIIETNFPTFKNYFSLYSKMPVHYFMTIDLETNFSVRIFDCINNDPHIKQATLCNNQDIIFNSDDFSLTYKCKNYKVSHVQHLNINSLLCPMKKFINIDIPTEFMILRSLVYQEIRNELPIVLEQLSHQYN